MDVFGTVTSVLQLIKTTADYAKAVRDAPRERMDLVSEISALKEVLTLLQRRGKSSQPGEPWFDAVQRLDAPLKQLELALTRLRPQVEGSGNKLVNSLKWPFRKAEITEALQAIERCKSIVSLALEDRLIELVERIHIDVNTLTFKVDRIVTEMDKDIKKPPKRTEVLTNQERLDLANWLSSIPVNEMQKAAHTKCTPDTGKWLLESPEFKAMLKGELNVLWCPGIRGWLSGFSFARLIQSRAAGAGKTSLVSIAVDYFRRNLEDNTAIVFFYCDYKAKYSVEDVLASLLRQLIQVRVTHDNALTTLEDYKRKGYHPAHNDLLKCLSWEMETYHRVFIVIDALDEFLDCNGTREALLDSLKGVLGAGCLLVTSREIPSIAKEFEEATCLDVIAKHEDMHAYVKSRIANERRLKKFVHAKSSLQDQILQTVTFKAKGMFLLARLHMNSIAAKTNLKAIYDALEKLPDTINSSYEEAMERIGDQSEVDRDLAYQTLSWLAHAVQPLSITDLQYALAVGRDLEMTVMDSTALDNAEDVLSACGGLVVLNRSTEIVSLVHYTTQDYIVNAQEHHIYRGLLGRSHFSIVCLKYLSFDCFQESCPPSEVDKLQKTIPFLSYAAHSWVIYAYESSDIGVIEAAKNFLSIPANVALVGNILFPCLDAPDSNRHTARNASGMHLCAGFGLKMIAKYLIDAGFDTDSRDVCGFTPLFYVAMNGCEPIGKMLLEMSADCNSLDIWRTTPLIRAVQSAHSKVVQLLLTRPDLDINHRDHSHYGGTALVYSVKAGHVVITELLLSHNLLDINGTDINGKTPLMYGAKYGHLTVVNLLLKRPDIQINIKGQDGKTALSYAAYNRHTDIVNLLLRQDIIDVNIVDKNTYTPLMGAILQRNNCRANLEIVKQLLMTDDVNVNLADKYGNTALSLAVQHENAEEIVEVLLAHKNIDINVMYSRNFGCTLSPLILASRASYSTIARKLIARHDVDINFKDHCGNSILLFPMQYGHIDVIKILIAQDNSDVNNADSENFGCVPLIWIAKNGYKQLNHITQQILKRSDIDINSKEYDCNAALSWAAKHDDINLIELLLVQTNLDVNTPDIYGHTPIMHSADAGHSTVVKKLLTRSEIKINHKSNGGDTALSCAAWNGHLDVVSLLLTDEHLDVDVPDIMGVTPLMCAVQRGHIAIVCQFLARADIDINCKDNQGTSALLYAVLSNETAILRLLLEQDSIEVNVCDNEGRTPLTHAAQHAHSAVIRQLLANSTIDIDCKDNAGKTALCYAATYGHVNIINLLLTWNYLDINVTDNMEHDALMCAVQNGHSMVVQQLLTRSEIDITNKDNDGETALSYAAQHGQTHIVELLLEQDTLNIDATNNYGCTPLMWASLGGHNIVVKQLLDKGVRDINLKDADGDTALSCAAQHGHANVIELLLAQDTLDINTTTNHGCTPLMAAAQYGHIKVVRQLLAHANIDINHKDSDGDTALSCAALYRHADVVKMLLLQDNRLDVQSVLHITP